MIGEFGVYSLPVLFLAPGLKEKERERSLVVIMSALSCLTLSWQRKRPETSLPFAGRWRGFGFCHFVQLECVNYF